MPAQRSQPAQATGSTHLPPKGLPLSSQGTRGAPASQRAAGPDAERERLRAEMIVAKIVPHVRPQALIAALLKHIETIG